jgi:hypothetical protein
MKRQKSKPRNKQARNTRNLTQQTSDPKPGASTASGSGGEPPKNPPEALAEERFYLDGGDALPIDRPGFVDAVNARIDLVRATELTLRGQDEKSTKSLLELLLEMKYGVKNAGNAKPQSPLDRLPQVLRD